MPEQRLTRIQAALSFHLQPVRPLAAIPLFQVGCVMILVPLIGMGAIREGTAGWSALTTAQRLVVFLSLAVCGSVLSVFSVRLMVPASKYSMPPNGLPLATVAALLLIMAMLFQVAPEETFVSTGMACLQNAIAYAAAAGLLFCGLLHRSASALPKTMGATVGLLAGLTGLAVREISCPNLNLLHIVAWHWSALLITSLIGVALGAASTYMGGSPQRDELANHID
ncbi:MAG: NrsF family protein [Bryobacteraceae bacterium]